MEAERQLHPRHQAGRDEPAGAAGPEAAAAASSRDWDLSGGREEGRCDQLSRVLQVRRELYAQCFDELIRQSTINCTERGLLLLRVRDELRMTLHAYQVTTINIQTRTSNIEISPDFVRVQHSFWNTESFTSRTGEDGHGELHRQAGGGEGCLRKRGRSDVTGHVVQEHYFRSQI